LVAPVTVADGAYVAAGSTITDDLGPGALGIARGRQHSAPGWVLRRRIGSKSAAAAQAALAAADVSLPATASPTTAVPTTAVPTTAVPTTAVSTQGDRPA
jgi:bifunctional UDP-N-acetylglucosamine pyrophosphorylase/glucosamine-1-phosphate N-acetyltransferase